jgi:hypothetical protein
MVSEQGILPGCESVGGIDGADGSGARAGEESGAAKPRYEEINREQLCWRVVDVERLIGEEHPARAVWEFVGQLDLRGYREEVRAVEASGTAGVGAAVTDQFVDLCVQRGSELRASDRRVV